MKHQAFNPYLPGWEYIPDGEPYVFGDRVYIYGSHDRFNGGNFCELNYVCWSAPVTDLGDWRFEGQIYDKRSDPICTGDNRLLFAPDVAVGPDGRYYLFYAFDFEGVISVAVCDTPVGEYSFYGHIHYSDGKILGKKWGDAFQFDPGALVDSDGRIYLYTGFCMKDLQFPRPEYLCENKGAMVVELEPDMLTVKSEPRFIVPSSENGAGTGFEGHEFFEASSMRKVNDKYYFIYSSVNGHELCYAVSSSPDKDFKFGGTIVSNGDIYLDGRGDKEALNYTGNNHGSIIEINGKWYVFYHRQTNRHQFSRQGCAEEIKISHGGNIPQVEITSCGLNGGPLAGQGIYEARIACNLMSAKGAVFYDADKPLGVEHPYFTQEISDGKEKPVQYIANLTSGSVAGFKYFDFRGVRSASVWVRTKGCGTLRIATAIDTHEIAAIAIEPSEEWEKYSAQLDVPDGVWPLYFIYDGEYEMDFLQFELK